MAIAACDAGTSPAPEGETIACAVGAGAELDPSCTLEILPDGGFVIHHPDGGFRRFSPTGDANRFEPADGADGYRQTGVEGQSSEVEITVGSDRYRFDPELASDSAR